MSVSYYTNQIRLYENKILQCQKQIQEKNNTINRLCTLNNQFNSLHNNLASIQSKRRNSLFSLQTSNLNMKFINTYVLGMKNLLEGSEYAKAYNTLSDSKSKIKNQINIITREIDAYNSDINYYRKKISNLNYYLKLELSK